MQKSIIFKSAAATAIIWFLWFIVNGVLPPDIWEGMELSKSALTVEYCEFNNPEAFFHQSINTYSNLAYFFFGFLILLIAQNDRHNSKISTNKLSLFPALSALAGIIMIYLCFGSAFFHASLTLAGQRVDMNGTYGITIILVILGIYHLIPTKNASPVFQKWIVVSSAVLVLGFYFIAPFISSGIVVPLLILASLALMLTEYLKHKSTKSIVLICLSFILIFIAVKIRTLDVQKIGCDPLSFFQGHALWHLLTAMSSFVTFCFYRFDFGD